MGWVHLWREKPVLPHSMVRRIYDVISLIRTQALFVTVAVLGVALSIAVIPRGRDLALLELEFGRASEALAVLEARYAAGERSLATIAVLSSARASIGDTLGAARLLEQSLPEHHNNFELLRTLVGYYRQLGQQRNALEILQRLQSLKPSQAQLDELASLYGEIGLKQQQRDLLREVVRGRTVRATHLVELAKLEGEFGNPRGGVDFLNRLANVYPSAMDTSIVALKMSLQVASGQVEDALETGRMWAAERKEPSKDIVHLASVVSVAGFPDKAVELLQPYITPNPSDALVFAVARAEADSGRASAALKRIEQHFATRQAAAEDELTWLRLQLAGAMPDPRHMIAAAEATDIQKIPEDVLAGIARAAVSRNRQALIAAIKRRLSEPGLGVTPLTAAEVYLALGDRERAASLSDQAVAGLTDNPLAAMKLALVEQRLMRPDRALAALRAGLPFDFMSEGPQLRKEARAIPTNILSEIARTYIRIDAALEGSTVFTALRQVQPSLEVEIAWALATSATRRSHLVSAWLIDRKGTPLPLDFLKQLIFLAVGRNDHTLAARAATRLVAARGNDSDRMLLAEVRTSFGIPLSRTTPESSTSTMRQPER
jgi:cellulose synthase operon protein C